MVNQINYGLINEANFIINIINDILKYYTHNEGKSVIVERFTKALNAKIYKKMTPNDSQSYLPYLNKLLDQYNNTYHHCIKKNLLMLIILL